MGNSTFLPLCVPKFSSFSSAPITAKEKQNETNILPTVRGLAGYESISGQTLVDVLDGQYDSQLDNYYLFDCRYTYEYNGGHIKTATNVIPSSSDNFFKKHLFTNQLANANRVAIFFHCEFSSKRGPHCYSLLRAMDQ